METPSPDAVTPAPDLVSTPSPELDIREILAEIETLGDSPELGVLRRSVGAEADGLFGFGTMYPGALIALLQNRFAGIGEPENLTPRPDWGYYYFADARYGLSWRSDIKVDAMDEATALAHESARLTRLRGELMIHLTENQRLFVYAGPATDDQIARIRANMRTYGQNTLLHLTLADDHHPAGHVAWQAGGLLRGYLSHYGAKDGGWSIAKEDWVTICRAAWQRWAAASRH